MKRTESTSSPAGARQANLEQVLLISDRQPLLRCLSRLFRLRGVRLLEQFIGLRELPFGPVIADQRVE
jgi:hypothetical protein